MPLRLFRKKRQTDLIVFVHVPKTAGTTVARHLSAAGLRGQDHIEHWLDHPDRATDRLQNLDWVSGHIPLPRMRSFLSSVTQRRLRFFSAIRSPVDQVASHYNWLMEIYYRGEEFYNRHSKEIHAISERIRKTDNTKPGSIITQLMAECGLFQNQQSRTVLGRTAPNLTTSQLEDILEEFEFVATEADLPCLVYKMTGTRSQVTHRDNKSSYHFDASIFRSPEILEFLAEFNSADHLLYDVVTSRNAPSDCHLPKRAEGNR